MKVRAAADILHTAKRSRVAQDASFCVEVMQPILRRLRESSPEVEQVAMARGAASVSSAGHSLRELEHPSARVPHAVGLALLENAARVAADPAFALRAGSSAKRGELGLYEYLSAASPTLRAAITLAIRYSALLHSGCVIDLVERGGYAHFRQRFHPQLARAAGMNDYVVASFVAIAQRQLGVDTPPSEVWFQHDTPSYAPVYEEIFKTKVLFGQPCNAVVMPGMALDLPMLAHDPKLLVVLTEQAELQLARVPEPPPLEQRVRRLMQERLARDPSLPAIAAALHTSERSLRRSLAAEGASHSQLLDSVRKETATGLLRCADLNVSEIAAKVGFAHRPAFHRACIRWYGKAPSELLRQPSRYQG